MKKTTAIQLAELSAWVDSSLTGKDPETILWVRVGKVGEEHGEAVEALIGVTNANPRKPGSHTLDDVRHELLDVATTALAAWAHLNGNTGDALAALSAHVGRVHARAGLELEGRRKVEAPKGCQWCDRADRPCWLHGGVRKAGEEVAWWG